MSLSVRFSRHAGSFYAGSKESLKKQIEGCFLHRLGSGMLPKIGEKTTREIFGIISPHAGYLYSGPVAAKGFYNLASDGMVDLFVVLGPNHHGVGSGVAAMNKGVWRTPFGDVEIDTEAATEIIRYSGVIDLDKSAHIYEHSIEVQLPFLQYIYGSSFKFVPICFSMQDIDTCREVGVVLAETLKGRNVVVIASTDMTHYEPHGRAVLKDSKAIDAIRSLDEEILYSVLENNNVSACGYGPVAALIVASRMSGFNKTELLGYSTSGDITGDKSAVVGYASLVIEK
jgi:AmmeMemoRadiSam system protein B